MLLSLMHNFILKIIWLSDVTGINMGGILTLVKSGLLPKHITDLESNNIEIRIDKSTWIVLDHLHQTFNL